MESMPASFTPEPRKMDTSATAANSAMVGAFILAKVVVHASFTSLAFMLWRPMVRMATSVKGIVPGRNR